MQVMASQRPDEVVDWLAPWPRCGPLSFQSCKFTSPHDFHLSPSGRVDEGQNDCRRHAPAPDMILGRSQPSP